MLTYCLSSDSKALLCTSTVLLAVTAIVVPEASSLSDSLTLRSSASWDAFTGFEASARLNETIAPTSSSRRLSRSSPAFFFRR